MTVELIYSASPAVGPVCNLVFGDTDAPTGVNLLFSQAPTHSTRINLVFGEDEFTVGSLNASLALNGTLPGMTMQVRACDYRRVTLTGVLPGMSMAVELTYASNTQRPTICRAATPWQVPTNTRAHTGVQGRTQIAQAMPTGNDAPWTTADPMAASAAGVHAQALRGTLGIELPQTDATHLGAPTMTAGFQGGIRTFSPSRRAPHQDAQRVGTQGTHLAHQDAYRDRRAVRQSLWQEALHNRGLPLQTKAGKALARNTARAVRFQEAMRPQPGVSVIIVPPKERCYTPDPNLLFKTPWSSDLNLVFICDRDTGVVPGATTLYILPARFYMTAHTIYAQRLPDLVEVPIFEATVSADSGSYCWTLSATGPSSLFTQLAPVNGLPVQLRVTMDGLPWLFAVDAISRTSAFGKTGVSISGRSVTALIGAPYLRTAARTNTEPRLAQQLALDALQSSGVDLDWGLTDWMVPTAAWSHQGTPLDAVQAIAQAAGGYLQSHRNAATLLTRHPYSQRAGDNPGAPWGWMSGPADVELAPDAIITEGLERRDGPDINALYVSGTTQGVLALVRRVGSAADKLAAMVTDPLITDAIAARQRGLAILGTAGPQYNVRLDLPVLTGAGQPGVLDVGQLVQINATQPWRGRVRAVSVNAKAPSLRQSITLERHL